jgi:hypothetical protein
VVFDAVRPGEEVFEVDAELRLNPRSAAVEPEPDSPEGPSWLPTVMLLAQAQDVRAALLLGAATLTLVGFTWLHEPAAPRRRGLARTPDKSLAERLRNRYRSS